ncbi:hypothetical protein FGO68_gene16081 [Halteria grandinella]|uniref:Uncharacterized protein n=1 Tax=Halteria grandinella TaxID=5974 RepID=A0A8J8T6G1_HALGN|nr:hypothetical protein FGO68_gene16081 [Halteria grandinella]
MRGGSQKGIAQPIMLVIMIKIRMWLTVLPCLVIDFTSTQYKSPNHFCPYLVNLDQPKCRFMISKISPSYSNIYLIRLLNQHFNSVTTPVLQVTVVVFVNLGNQSYNIADRHWIF